MDKNCFVWIALVALWWPNVASAAVFERDWQTPGDGLLTYDDVNQREWLDISVSLLSQFPGDRIEDRIANAAAELQPGGLFEGFTWAKSGAVIALAQSAGIDTGTSDYATNHEPMQHLISLLGATYTNEDGTFTRAYLNEVSTPPPGATHRYAHLAQFNPLGAGLYINDLTGHDVPQNISGLMLYHPVPEPSTAGMTTTALFVCLNLLRRGSRFSWRERLSI